MSILQYFCDWKNVAVEVFRNVVTPGGATGRPSEVRTSQGTKDVIFYVGSQAEGIVADKIRDRVSAVAIFDPSDDVKTKDELTINNVNYNVIDVDNIAFQGEAQVVALERKS